MNLFWTLIRRRAVLFSLLLFLAACSPGPPPITPTPTAAAPTPEATATPAATETAAATETPAPAAGPITFTTTAGGARRDRGINIQQTADGGYIFIGYTSSDGAGQEDIYLVRLDEQGNLLWTQTYGGDRNDNGWAVVETEEGGFLLFGFTASFGAGGMDMYLVRTDPAGNLLWEQTYGGPEDEYGWAMVPAAGGGYLLAGQTASYGQGDIDGYVVRVDDEGQELWSQTIGGPAEDRLFSVDQSGDGGFVLSGTTTSFGAGSRDSYLVKVGGDGALVWEQFFGEAQDDVGHAVQKTADGGFIVTGYTKSFAAQNYDAWLIKTDAAGRPEWQHFYGDNQDDRAIYGQQTADGGFIFTGYTRSFGAVGWDVYLVRTDPAGELLWQQTFGGSADDTGYTAVPTTDGGFILTGETYSTGQGGGDMYILKVDADGDVGKE